MAGVRKRVGTSISSFITILQKDIGYMNSSAFLTDYLLGGGRFNQSRAGGLKILSPLKQRLFNKGVDGKGKKLAPYSEAYKKFKKTAGFRSSPTTLRFKGDWYDSMYIYHETSPNSFAVEVRTRENALNEPDKTEYLKSKYGGDILTLNKEEEALMIADMQERIGELFSYDLSSLKFEIT